ncbi:hypothetical protein K8F61_15005 [Microbacterium resistens]|uniref:DUF308 domain-containing protein n=1 Tax=Microbacterium resistens TaxID=156977 RepID=A0ABY3RSS7_9MICO|nr:hypothetical protein [Microbacterium resistens]UGS25939.1 hypothetical protein K8F61_15005 [Microbacterium resistens]
MPSDSRRPDDSAARRAVAICTWAGIGTAALGVLLVAVPSLLPVGGPWVQLALGAITLFLAFRARAIGMRGVNDFDGRLGLLAAIAGFAIIFFAGQVAFATLSSLGG